MQRNNVDFRVFIKGRPITEYFHNGDTYVEGRSGSNFELELTNRNTFRVEVIISVDGLSVVDGQEASDKSTGYLLEAYQTIRIPGWKLDGVSAASFMFAGKAGSYATQMTGSSNNNGVIGIMAYREKPVYRPVLQAFGHSLVLDGARKGMIGNPMRSLYGSNSAQASYTANLTASSAAADMSVGNASLNNLGTGFGKATSFATTEVEFNRGDLLCVAVLYYDNARGLKARGIEIQKPSREKYNQQPQAFPGMSKGCIPPSGWNG